MTASRGAASRRRGQVARRRRRARRAGTARLARPVPPPPRRARTGRWRRSPARGRSRPGRPAGGCRSGRAPGRGWSRAWRTARRRRTTRRSQARASWKPAPMAWPWTAATDTTSLRRHQVKRLLVLGDGRRRVRRRRRARDRGTTARPSNPSGVNACRSSPAEKDLPSARSTTTRTLPGSSRPGLGQRPPQGGRLRVALGRVGQRHRGDGVVDGEPYAVLVEQGRSWSGVAMRAPPVSAVSQRSAK